MSDNLFQFDCLQYKKKPSINLVNLVWNRRIIFGYQLMIHIVWCTAFSSSPCFLSYKLKRKKDILQICQYLAL